MTATAAEHTAIDVNLALVIDDDAELRQFIAATLKQLGMRVADFDMAKDALASLGSQSARKFHVGTQTVQHTDGATQTVEHKRLQVGCHEATAIWRW